MSLMVITGGFKNGCACSGWPERVGLHEKGYFGHFILVFSLRKKYSICLKATKTDKCCSLAEFYFDPL